MTSTRRRSAAAVAVLSGVLLAPGAVMASTAAPDVRASDAPRVVRVGAAHVTVPVTVITGAPGGDLETYVVDHDDHLLAYGYARSSEPGRPEVFKTAVELDAADIDAWGAHTWQFAGYPSTEDEVASVEGRAPVDLRAHSMLGMTTTRVDEDVTVRGSARAYHNVEDRYVPWSGRPVSVQRWTGQVWLQVGSGTTDPQGNLTCHVTVPSGSELRLVTRDTSGTWGAVSTVATV